MTAFPLRYPRSKYGARRTVVDNITFASKAEARVYGELKLREKAGEIVQLQTQVPFRLSANGEHVCAYIADFCFVDAHSGEFHCVDVKGFIPAAFRLKAKLFRACFGFDVEIVR